MGAQRNRSSIPLSGSGFVQGERGEYSSEERTVVVKMLELIPTASELTIDKIYNATIAVGRAVILLLTGSWKDLFI